MAGICKAFDIASWDTGPEFATEESIVSEIDASCSCSIPFGTSGICGRFARSKDSVRKIRLPETAFVFSGSISISGSTFGRLPLPSPEL